MLRVDDPNKAWIKRPLRQLYSHTAAQPADEILDPAWDRSIAIFPGMCAMKKASAASGAGDLVTLLDATGIPYGLFGEYIGGDGIDEPLRAGISATPIWVLGPQSEFEVDSPSFDAEATWTFPTDGTPLYVHAYTGASSSDRGVLCPVGATGASAVPVAVAVRRPSENTLVIRGLPVGPAYTLPT